MSQSTQLIREIHPGFVYIFNDGTHYLSGAIDELHVSRMARSDDWIMLAFENQRQDQHLVTIGIEK
jgi:hypothetical protein